MFKFNYFQLSLLSQLALLRNLDSQGVQECRRLLKPIIGINEEKQ